MEIPNPRFLSNIQDESTNIWQPITGYEREPLLSLEEVYKPLYSLIDIIFWISKYNYRKPEDDLIHHGMNW